MIPFLIALTGDTSTATTVVANAIDSVDLSGILNEIVALLPVLLPTLVGFIGIRKAISFAIGSLRRA